MAYSANQEQVFSPLDQSGVSNFALGERKIKKKCPLFRPISIQSFCPLCYKRFKGEVFNAFVKVIPNFYSCKANVEFTKVCFDGIDVIG